MLMDPAVQVRIVFQSGHVFDLSGLMPERVEELHQEIKTCIETGAVLSVATPSGRHLIDCTKVETITFALETSAA